MMPMTPKRHADFADAQAVRFRPFGDGLANGIGQGRDLAHASRHVLDARGGQQQAVAHRAFQAGVLDVFAVRRREYFSRLPRSHRQSRAGEHSSRRSRAGPASPMPRGRAAVFPASKAEMQALAINATLCGWKISSDLARHTRGNRLGMPAVHDGHMNSRLAGEFCGTQLGKHPAAPKRTLAIALRFQCGRQFPDHSLQSGLFAPIGNQESVDIGKQQQPICLHCCREK